MRESEQHGLAIDLVNGSDFEQISELVFQLVGIDLKPSKTNMIAARLGKRLRATGMASVQAYIKHLHSDEGLRERNAFISAFTTNMTRFNREGHHFEHLSEQVLPSLVRRARQGDCIRLWSAGCSSGEEPYQMAFHLLEQCPEAADLDVKILATDIDRSVVDTAQVGVYPRAHVASLPGQQSSVFFEPVTAAGDRLRVTDAARRIVTFRQLNLLADWPFNRKFDAVMCRNVAIYFNAEVQTRLWKKFSECLAPEGVIYIGHSESFGAVCEGQFQLCGSSAFRLDQSHQQSTRADQCSKVRRAV